MSLSLSEPETARSAREPKGSDSETRNIAPSETPSSAANEKSFSIAHRVALAALAGQVVFAAALVLVAARYAGADVAIYAGAAALLWLILANAFVIRTVRRSLDPLRDLAERANQISAKNWKLGASAGAGLPQELLPLAESVDAALSRLQTAFRRQGDFTSDAAHELKTSVAIVKSALQLLLHRPRTQREYQIGLEELLEDCARLENLLERMLRLSRIEQMAEGGARPKRASVDLAATCEAAVSRIHAMAEERGVTLQLEASASFSLPADPEDLELIWMNLLENAVQNSPPGSAVKMRLQQGSDAMAQVSVMDSGAGIAPADLPHIFERFRRGESAPARSACGSGLGLAICKAVVGAYGGTIEAANLPGQGAEFRVNLPVSRP
ncbi:MAG: HAMP domain-containing histidine kinase [Acidobacteriia bacterium]|nr:HAMP domain-containing histidine kinase [Terriglobia bacterium]